MPNVLGNSFGEMREPLWRKIGIAIQGGTSLVEALEFGNMDYTVEKYPLYASTPWGNIEVPKEYAAVRNPVGEEDPKVFGTVGKNYQILQNRELVSLLEPLNKKWPVETVGSLRDGDTVFFALKAGGMQVAGEDVDKYFLVADDKGGRRRSLRICFTPVRVVCQNTLVAALKNSSMMVFLRHYNSLRADVTFHLGLIEKMQKVSGEMQEKFSHLATIAVSNEKAKGVLEAVYPNPVRPNKVKFLDSIQNDALAADVVPTYMSVQEAYGKQVERATKLREAVLERYENFPQTNVAGTAWALYNTVVEAEDYRKGGGAAESALFGPRAERKSKTFELLLLK